LVLSGAFLTKVRDDFAPAIPIAKILATALLAVFFAIEIGLCPTRAGMYIR
jgi:hypothetical protein